MNPRKGIKSELQNIETLPGQKQFHGFIKRFENVNNKPMVLYARASHADQSVPVGLMVVPQIFEEVIGEDKIISKASKLPMPLDKTINKNNDFYQVLIGDTKYVQTV